MSDEQSKIVEELNTLENICNYFAAKKYEIETTLTPSERQKKTALMDKYAKTVRAALTRRTKDYQDELNGVTKKEAQCDPKDEYIHQLENKIKELEAIKNS